MAGDVHVITRPGEGESPYCTLDDLQTVVEALCPVWPDRGVPVSMARMRL